MAEGLTVPLFAAAAVAWVGCTLILARALSLRVASGVSAVKAALPLAYFAWVYDGTWALRDGLTYAEQGAVMLQRGFTPWSALLTNEGRDQLAELSGGPHFLYGWWNLLAQWMFGTHYWSAVFLNVILTSVAFLLFCSILSDLGFPGSYTRGYLVVGVLHLEVLAWSSVANVKDILVLTLATLALLFGIRVTLARRYTLMPLLVAVLYALLWLRAYIAVLIAIMLGVWLLARAIQPSRAGRSWPWVFAAATGIAAALAFAALKLAYAMAYISVSDPLLGVARFALTPRPWAVDPSYSFLVLPAVLHWLLIVPMAVAAVLLWLNHRDGRVFLAYLAFVALLYGLVPELQGPRHRVQVLTIVVWIQFHALWVLLQATKTAGGLFGRPARPPERGRERESEARTEVST